MVAFKHVFSMVFLHPKMEEKDPGWRRQSFFFQMDHESCLVSNDVCLRPIWCGNLMWQFVHFFAGTHGTWTTTIFFKSKMLKLNFYNVGMYLTTNSPRTILNRNLTSNQKSQTKNALNLWEGFFLNHRSSGRLQSTVNTSIGNASSCICIVPKCSLVRGFSPQTSLGSSLGITRTM